MKWTRLDKAAGPAPNHAERSYPACGEKGGWGNGKKETLGSASLSAAAEARGRAKIIFGVSRIGAEEVHPPSPEPLTLSPSG